jgi:hypothetical protein
MKKLNVTDVDTLHDLQNFTYSNWRGNWRGGGVKKKKNLCISCHTNKFLVIRKISYFIAPIDNLCVSWTLRTHLMCYSLKTHAYCHGPHVILPFSFWFIEPNPPTSHELLNMSHQCYIIWAPNTIMLGHATW